MIKIESVHIEETRGIRKLDLAFGQKTFAISGPNGSGKSGVIDAIDFGLTGQIGRLTGRGTKGLTVSEHGPHVDKTKFPDAAFVRLEVFLTGIGKTATITRKIATPNKPQIDPPDVGVKEVLAEVADHPEITLSRREILRFILVEPTARSEEIQTLLKLEEIGQTRAVLNTTQNRLQIAFKTATDQAVSARSALMRHLQIATFKAGDLLASVNARRTLLGLPTISELTGDAKLDAGLSVATKPFDFNKESALRDLRALADAAKGFAELGKAEAAAITADLARLDEDPALLAALQRRSFIERGLELVDGPACPLWCARLTGEGQPVEVRRKEGVTNHFRPESCAGRCEAAGEALTGARTGRDIEHRKRERLERRDCHSGRRQHRHHRNGEGMAGSTVSENPCTFVRPSSGPGRSSFCPGSRTGAAAGRRIPYPMMYGMKKSDEAIVPVKAANKGAPTPAESPEGRASTKGNLRDQSTHRTQGRDGVSQAVERIRQAATPRGLPSTTQGRSRMR